MQIKHFFLFCLFLHLQITCIAQPNWILPLSAAHSPNGAEHALFFHIDQNKKICFDAAGSRYELPAETTNGLGRQLFLIEKDGYKGIFEAGEGEIIPMAYERIEVIGCNFFVVSIYGARAILNKQNKILVDYTFKPIIPLSKGCDTLLLKNSLHPDAKAQGFLKDGAALNEALCTNLYPKSNPDRDAMRRKVQLAPVDKTKHIIFSEKMKFGLKDASGTIIVAAEFDQIIYGLPGFFAAKKGTEWGLFKL
jgi:hypothetical protein